MHKSLLMLGLLWPGIASAQLRTDSGAFVATLGRDTVAVERYVRTPTSLSVYQVTRLPETRLLTTTVRWSDSGRLLGYEQLNAPVPGTGGATALRTIATVSGDSIRVEVSAGNNLPRVRTAAAPVDVPFLNLTYSLYETLLARAAAQRPSELSLLAGSGKVTYSTGWRADSVTLSHPQGGIIRIALDDAGRMRAYDGSQTTFKVQVTRAAAVNVDSIARGFALREASGAALGMLSPRDTARARLEGSIVMIDYGRPAARGRVIFGEVVPWEKVWRTGANAATQLEIDRPIQIGSVTIPAGKYSLWTIPGRTQWQLIVNKQTGQWGTDYDPAQDLVRIPVRSTTIRDADERFTISIVRQRNGGVIQMTWENTRAIVPFTFK